MAEKVPWTIYRPKKKVKQSVEGRVTNEFSIKNNIKALKYKSCLGFPACQKKIVELTDSTHAIYWPTNIAKKQQTVEVNISIYVSTKYLPI